jgi:hypothetical protein
MNRLPFILILIFLFFNKNMVAQKVVAATGMSAINAGFQLSWTVGEPVAGTVAGGNSVLTQGFHQSKLTVTSVIQYETNKLELKVFPNPFNCELTIENVKNNPPADVYFILYDIAGKKLVQKQMTSSVEKLQMGQYAPGSYIMKFYSAGGILRQAFKLQKVE